MNGEEEYIRHRIWMQSNKALLSAVRQETCQPYSIPVVPDNLRKVNLSAYIPKVISIGPQYKGREELLQMEEIKRRCVITLLSRTIGLDAIEGCMESILELDATVRASYVDEIKLDRYDLANTMVIDGCFMLELMICESMYDSEVPIPLNGISPRREIKKMEYVMSDLLLMDNQIPIYILEILFQRIIGDSPQMRELIQNLVLSVFHVSGIMKVKSAFHFLYIVYSYIEMGWIDKKIEENPRVIIHIDKERPMNVSYVNHGRPMKVSYVKHNLYRCATRLKAVGITIQLLDIPTDINFILTTYTEFDQSKRILKIQRLVIEPTTEVLWRTFIAWERHNKKWRIGYSSVTDRHSPFSFSAMLFSDLICCPSDVQLLKDRGIIVDKTEKSNRDLVAFFHSIAMGVDRDIIDSNHASMLYALNTLPTANYATRIFLLLPHWCYYVYQFFKRNYNFAATILSFLTVVQTCYSVYDLCSFNFYSFKFLHFSHCNSSFISLYTAF